jgi:hypothetical protein
LSVKIREANLAELAPKERKPRELSPRQLAIRKRDQLIGNVLRELEAAPKALIKKVELDDGERLPTIRAAITKQIRRQKSSVNVAVRNGVIFLAVGPLPRAGRRAE